MAYIFAQHLHKRGLAIGAMPQRDKEYSSDKERNRKRKK
jgi:hypothetical protein